ncbi:MAG: TRAP transporter permease [Salinigranum sp.]
MTNDIIGLSEIRERVAVPSTPAELRTAYIWVLGVTWALFQLYAAIGVVHVLTLVHVHVLAAISMAFALNPTPSDRVGKRLSQAIDTALAVLPMVILVYLIVIEQRLMERIAQVGPVTNVDIVLGTLTVLLLLEATRRALGNALPIIGKIVVAYGFAGPFMPSLISHSGLTYPSMVDLMFLDDRAIFGIPAKISARYVYLFILFGAVLLESGAGDLFLEFAKSVAGSLRGGPAKMAVISSAMMATINGSAVANTVSTGSITIPLMERSGYDKESAGAIEALASTGGQYMPPVMGAAAFVLAQLAGVPYLKVIIYAAIPATLYYVGVMSSVHFVAVRQGVGSLPRDELPSRRKALADVAHIGVPVAAMLFIMFDTGSVETAAAVTVLVTMAIVALRDNTRMRLLGYLTSFKNASEMVLASALPTAIAGMIIGVVFYSGIATRIVHVILTLTGGTLIATLLLVAVAAIVLGMGMPTTGAYITVAILAVPSLVALGVPKISAHLFGLYFSVVSMVTPPIALAAFAAASVSGGDAWKTGIKAFKLGLPVYLIPFAFVFHPSLLTINSSAASIVLWTLVAAVLMIVFAAVGVGYGIVPLSWPERILAGVGGIIIIFLPAYQLVGAVVLLVGVARQFRALVRSDALATRSPF